MTLQMRAEEVSTWGNVRQGGTVDIEADRLVVERFQAGDTAAFDVLYRQYYRRLRSFCLRRVDDPHDAEEITQEAFAKAYAALPSFAGERRFYPWVSVIASRLCVDHHRRQGRVEPAAELEDGPVDGGQERVLIELDSALIRHAMARLPDRHRDILRLREEEGWSYKRLADHYGLSVGAVESLLLRARRRLRQEFVTLSGGERSLAAVPVLGIVWHRLQAVARRFAAQPVPGELGGLAVHAVTAAAVALGLLVPAITGGGPADAGSDQHTPAPLAVAQQVDAAAGPDAPIAPAADAASGGLVTGPSDRVSRGPALGVVAVAGAVPGASARSDSGARSEVDEKAEVQGVAWVGADSGDVASDVERRSDEIDRWIAKKGQPPCVEC